MNSAMIFHRLFFIFIILWYVRGAPFIIICYLISGNLEDPGLDMIFIMDLPQIFVHF